MSVGAVKLKIIFLRAVPPSADFTPLSANTPRAALISSTPPARTLAVPPTVNIPCPSCATDVLLFWLVFANLSTKLSTVPALSPRADIESVTMSEASPSSIPPAAAKFRTVGNVETAFSASYPARAR